MSDHPRKIIHCDCDCFFAAVEIRDNPELRALPVAIGGSSDRRGVISTCNYVARKFGIRSAMNSAKALQLCPDLIILPGNMDKYREASVKINRIFEDYTDLVEPLSLDEAFLDVSESNACHGSATLIAEEIRARVRKEVGITISAGVAPNKFVAKVASDWNKPDGLCVVTPEKVDAFVKQLPIERIFGVGKVTAGKLHAMGILNCGDLRDFELPVLTERFGRFGSRLHQLCRGIDDRPVQISRIHKSVSIEHTYPIDLLGVENCLDQLPELLEQLHRRLRRYLEKDSGYKIKGRFAKVRFNDFTTTTIENQLQEGELKQYQVLIRQGHARGEKPVRLLGIGVRLDVDDQQAPEQLTLFT
ncbi:DNA polymerase IV [Pelagibaculum spongiae]|uniref:DNA polymerase IV n=1 Tax=Pelagibaculum spongiae TaxID=2080658 RepID=A0A2V1GP10_9GAMM|nr:DNA polymerase IV [Pelagibaculum spongiae]PVZ63902.1 DNA polymerase IV [Pelagibaculum spongiae]